MIEKMKLATHILLLCCRLLFLVFRTATAINLSPIDMCDFHIVNVLPQKKKKKMAFRKGSFIIKSFSKKLSCLLCVTRNGKMSHGIQNKSPNVEPTVFLIVYMYIYIYIRISIYISIYTYILYHIYTIYKIKSSLHSITFQSINPSLSVYRSANGGVEMGGPCFLVEGQSKVRGPPCTDNFQIRPFQYRGQVYHSCEQAYQAMKYKEGSKARDMVAKISPRDGESSRDHGMRCWSAGNAGTADEKCSNWDEVKVDTMLDVNRAKYAQYSDLCEELLKTGDIEIVGGPSTSWVVQGRDHLWETWNGRIQMLIREELKKTPNRTRLESLREYFTSYKSLFCVVGGVPRIPPAEPKVSQSTEEHEIDIRSTEPTLSALKAELEELKKFGFEIPWTCPSCTILNESFPSICELCSTINEQYKSAMEARMAAAKDGVGTVITERIKTFSSLLVRHQKDVYL